MYICVCVYIGTNVLFIHIYITHIYHIKILSTPNLEFNLFFPPPRSQFLVSAIIYGSD